MHVITWISGQKCDVDDVMIVTEALTVVIMNIEDDDDNEQ